MDLDGSQRIRSLFADLDVLLFDFDGPLCDVFAGVPAPLIARQLEAVASESFATDDPLEIVRQAFSRLGPRTARIIEDALIEAELAAVRVATAESSGIASIRAAVDAGMRVGVVTNNVADAAEWFLRYEQVDRLVGVTIGRPFRRPDLMKPNPWPLLEALNRFGVPPDRAALIGDSRTDIEACRAAGMQAVALANKPGKRAEFESAGATVIVDEMAEVLHVLVDMSDVSSSG